jgi:hypothetical protein
MGRTHGCRRSRVRVDARAARANKSSPLHIQHRRPNDLAYRAPNWNKHSLGQWVELMGVGDPECALMHAQTCARHHTYRIGARRAGPNKPQIGTKTYCSNGHKLWGSACAQRAPSGRRSRPARERSARTSAKGESTGMEQGAATAASAKFECGSRCKQK